MKTRVIYGRYWVISGCCGVVGVVGGYVGSRLLAGAVQVDVTRSLATISVTFALTFAAFSFTALALLQLLQDRTYFAQLRQSDAFKSFLARFFLSVKMNLSLLVFATLVHIFLTVLPALALTLTMACLSGAMFFIVAWIWTCLSTFIELFRE